MEPLCHGEDAVRRALTCVGSNFIQSQILLPEIKRGIIDMWALSLCSVFLHFTLSRLSSLLFKQGDQGPEGKGCPAAGLVMV